MTEQDAIAACGQPITEATLLAGLRGLGIRRGDTVIAHCAMSHFGWVCGREVAVVRALLRAVGPFGVLVMPAHTGDNSDPANWCNPPVPQGWFAPIRDAMPAYDRRVSPSRAIGRVAECLRTWPGTRRSAHPQVSWCAHGLGAAWLLRGHSWKRLGFGMQTPLGRLYRRNAKILMLGVGFGNCTALHMAETLCPATPMEQVGAAVRTAFGRRWVNWPEIEMDSDRFPQIGEAFEQSGGEVRHGKIANADCLVTRVRPLVDFGVQWLGQHPATAAPPHKATTEPDA